MGYNNAGYLFRTFKPEELQFLRDEVSRIKETWDAAPHNHHLVGHIQRQYALDEKVYDQLESLLQPFVEEYPERFPQFYNNVSILSDSLPVKLQSAWVNFQKKHEYNPVHDHDGLFSFVIWLDIPYNIEDERNHCESRVDTSGCFCFYYINQFGAITDLLIPADKKAENTALFFHAGFKHAVYPFYTSDNYRISVSGNFCLKV